MSDNPYQSPEPEEPNSTGSKAQWLLLAVLVSMFAAGVLAFWLMTPVPPTGTRAPNLTVPVQEGEQD